MQRLGFVKYTVYKCSLRDSSTLNGIGKGLLDTVTKKFSVSLNQSVKDYIQLRLTNRIYRDIREIVKKIGEGSESNNSVSLELQDIYLSSQNIPSKTGKLISDDRRKYPYFAISLGMVRKGTYSLLVRGKVLLEFTDKEEVESFNQPTNSINPFILTTDQKIIFLYSLLEGDGDVLNPLYAELTKKEDSFSDRDAGDYLPFIYHKIYKSFNSRVTTGVEKDKLERLRRSADTIEKWKGKPYTGKGAREQSITPRLEPFVDLGFLKKQDPYKYEYRFSEQGGVFFDSFCVNEDVGKFLDDYFFLALNKSFKLEANPAKKHEIMEALFSAFNTIKSPLGYAPIKEIALFGAIRALVDKREYFEIGQATKLIMEYQKSHPYAARFQVDRSGAPVYVKFLNNSMKP